MSHELLAKNFAKYIDLTPMERNTICPYYHSRTVEKGQYILRPGEVCKFEAFVVRGCFTISASDDEGKERILYFAAEDWWVMDHDSFTNHIGSKLSVQAIEDSELLTISTFDKELLFTELPKAERLFLMMSQKAVVAWQRRLVRNHTMSAEERYQHFIRSYPEIARRVTNKQIGSYLGITHEFVSKIRKRWQQKNRKPSDKLN